MIYEGRPGRRVATLDEVMEGTGGEYWYNPTPDSNSGHRSLWFKVPEAAEPGTDRFMRGPCRIDTTWQITEEADGTITVSPSIAVATSADGGNVWHGYLEHGQWRSVE